MKYKTLKNLKARKNARKRNQTTEKAIQALIIGLALVLVLLAGCSYSIVPYETKIEYGTTDTDSEDSDKDKFNEKKSITQTWRWIND